MPVLPGDRARLGEVVDAQDGVVDPVADEHAGGAGRGVHPVGQVDRFAPQRVDGGPLADQPTADRSAVDAGADRQLRSRAGR